jgi:hypothetical protein
MNIRDNLDNKKIKIKNFMKHLNIINFPKEKYYALYDYPNTIIENKNKKKNPINEFTKKYKKKFLQDINLQDTLKKDKKIDNLFKESIDYIAKFQKNILKNKNMETYITGGSALKLYSMLDDNKSKNDNILTTPDFDMYLSIETPRMTNNLIIKELLNIINSVYLIIKNPNYMTLDLHLLLNFENTNSFIELVHFFMNNDYDLFRFNPFDDGDCFCYYFKFIKLINKEFCIKITIKYTSFSNNFKKGDKNGILLINNYYFDYLQNFKLCYNFLPIELVIIKKNEENLKLIGSTIKIDNKILYIFNEKAILYNLLNLAYKYQYLLDDKSIKNKLNSQKNKRDNQRLEYFFNYYCNIYYPQLTLDEKYKILTIMKSEIKNFSKSVIQLKKFKSL